ncbi:MAG: hypothetical protein U1D30_14880 [Planctomycetota bacterium]
MPDYLAMGSVSEDITGDLEFWRDFDLTNKRMDVRYTSISTAGPSMAGEAGRTDNGCNPFLQGASSRNGSLLVWYNIPDGGESYFTNKELHREPSVSRRVFQ